MAQKPNTTIDYVKNSRIGQYLRAKFARPLHVLDDSLPGMIGSGIKHKDKHYITHTTLDHSRSALTTFVPWQFGLILTIVALISVGFVVSPLHTAIVLVGILSFIYLVDVFFNLFVIMKSLHLPPEISVSDEKIALLEYLDLPVYTVLCPLYKEAHVLPQFIEAMGKMDYPKNKLEIMLLLEEDDEVTIAAASAMDLPSNFRIVVVPDGKPKTKPKACNYGLGMARGEFIVVYDAEDQPDPLQLKQAYYAFRQSSKKVVCLQAKLNYYNPTHNLLTRLFTAEYSLWFDVILPGLQSIGTSIPLGGTSNHFRTADLRQLEGWDPFNVTEDCDLGARIFQSGYQTAIIDSTTLEEANSNTRNWFRQRSRWLKGYMQTYLVHMRRPLSFMRRHGIHSLIFQLIVGGRIAFILINPLLWALTIAYFVLYAQLGPSIEAIFPGPIFYMAVTSLLLGNFTYLYNYMIGCAKRGHWNLIKYVFLIPIYWLMISYAATIALFQLFFKPHYWEKTIHGFHLDPSLGKKTATANAQNHVVARARSFQALADRFTSVFNAGGVIVIASVFSNFLNFLYTSYLGRNLTLEDFGAISIFGSLSMVIQVPIGALGNAVTHKVAYLFGKYQIPVKDIWVSVRKNSRKVAIIASLIYLTLIPLLQNFFNFSSVVPFLLFTPSITIATLAAVDGGYLGGLLMFSSLAILTSLEAISKLLFATTLINLGLHEYVYAVIPLSMSTSLVLGYLIVRSLKSRQSLPAEAKVDLSFPQKFYNTSIITSLTALAYTTIDLVLAKHYLSPADAGIYSYLSLAGKMVFLTSGMFSGFIVPYVSRAVGSGRQGKRFFRKLLFLVTCASLFSFIVFGAFGHLTVPLLWGDQALGILPYLLPYALSMVFYSISSLYTRYHLIRGENAFAYAGFVVAIIQTIAILLHHDSVGEIATAVVVASVFSLVFIVSLDRFYQQAKDLYRVMIDFLGLFKNIPRIPKLENGKLRILIFNWRDLRHKWAGGAEVYLHELAKRWVEMGHEVTIFSGNDGKSARFERFEGVRLVRRGGFYLVYLWAFLYYFLRLRGRYDVIIDSENGLPFFTPLYVREPVFLLIHHVHQEVFRKSLIPPFSWLAQFLEKRIMPAVYRKTEVITVSPSSKAEIIAHKLTRRNPHVVYNGVNLDICQPSTKSKVPTILYLGRLTTAKSVDVLIRAAKQIVASVPKVKIIIAGDGPTRQSLERLTKKLGLSSTISFTGKVTESEKLSLYQQAWVFVNPSLIEGWGITTIEANACGTPVVASNVAGLRDAVKNPHSGYLVPYGDVDEFALTITKLLKNTRMRRRMSRESVDWAKNFDWNDSAKQAIDIIKRPL